MSNAELVSADGTIVAGYAFPPDARIGPKGFRWTAATGMVHLGTHGDDAIVRAMSSDGKVIVGTLRSLIPDADRFATINEPFVWTESRGMQTLQDVLSDLRVNDDTWFGDRDVFHFINDFSANGRYILGSSITFVNEVLSARAWIVDLDPLPEPSTLCLAVVGLSPILLHRRSR